MLSGTVSHSTLDKVQYFANYKDKFSLDKAHFSMKIIFCIAHWKCLYVILSMSTDLEN